MSHTRPSWLIKELDRDHVIVRSPTAQEPQPADWLERLHAALRLTSHTTVVGAKRVTADGHLVAMGEMVIHPKGLHRVGHGLNAHAYRFPEEVDASAGGVLLVKADAFQAARGTELLRGELGAVHLCLALRAAGGRCLVIPDVTVMDPFAPRPDAEERAAFARVWGFDCLAPDMDEVRDLYHASPLLWNVRLHGRPLPYDKYAGHGAALWMMYEHSQAFQHRADAIARLAAKAAPTGVVLNVACGDGLYAHLLAKQGLDVIGADTDQARLDLAAQRTADQHYPGPAPKFFIHTEFTLPLKKDAVRLIALIDVIERWPNSVRALRELNRVLAPGGGLLIVTPEWQYGVLPDYYHLTHYTADELLQLVPSSAPLRPVWVRRGDNAHGDLLALFAKT